MENAIKTGQIDLNEKLKYQNLGIVKRKNYLGWRLKTMSLRLGNGRVLKINDRTLSGINPEDIHFSRLDVINFCWMLRDIGIDLIEVNGKIIDKLKKMPKGLDYLFRISTPEDLQKCIDYNFQNCVLTISTFFKYKFYEVLKEKDKIVTIEIPVEVLESDIALEKLKRKNILKCIGRLRITGNVTQNSDEYISLLNKVKVKLNIPLDICPENRFFNATAITVEAVQNAEECITVAFLGYGKVTGFAALEEVITALKVFMKFEGEQRLKLLPEISKQFSKLTGIEIPYSKAILGKGIFKFESGIHADGIKKNSYTYEPFEPESIGQERELIIGKHSGSRSIMHKLKELGIHCKKEEAELILKDIRTKSIENKRNLNNHEIMEIYENLQCSI